MNPFRFTLGQKVAIVASGETGTVTGRAEYTNAANSYLVRYRAANGVAAEIWWQEDALSAVPD